MTRDFFPRYDYHSLIQRPCITTTPFPRFQALKGLATSNPVYARELRNAVTRLRAYFDQEGEVAPLNCLVLGPPGAGKTYLAKQLAKSFEDKSVEFEEHNLSNTDSAEYLTKEVFTPSETKKVVFVDEFDVSVSGSSVVRFLLDPLTQKRRHPTVYIFSGSYLKNIHVLRTLSKSSSDFDFMRFLLDVYLNENTIERKREVLELYEAASRYSDSRKNIRPDSDVVAYLRTLDKLQDFLSRINGFIIQVPDVSSPMTITRPALSLSLNDTNGGANPITPSLELMMGQVSAADIFDFVQALEEPRHLHWRRFCHPDEPVLDYKNMLLTERYGLLTALLKETVQRLKREADEKVGISRQLLNGLSWFHCYITYVVSDS